MDQQSTKSRRARRTSEQIAELLKKFSESGSTVRQFCQDHQIVPGTFHKWQSRVKAKYLKQPVKAGFMQIQVDSSLSRLFAEIKGICFYQPVSAAYLKELLA